MNRQHVDNILPSHLQEYMKEFESDMKITQENLHDKTLSRSAIAAKWARYSYEQERFKNRLTEEIDKLKEKAQKALFQKKKQLIEQQNINMMQIKIDAQKIVKKSSQYIAIQQQIKDQDDIVRFLIQAKQIVSSFGFDIKNAIQMLKLQNI